MKLIAQNSVLINAAMRKQTDSLKVAQKWLAHDVTKAPSVQDVESAKTWVKINVQMDSIPLKNALKKIYGSGWAFGATDARNEISSEVGFDWDEWEPGNESAAVLADAPRGLRTMLDRRGVTIKGLNDVTLDRIGSSLALSLSQGLGMEETANMIDYILDDPARSMVIARTETADALVQANVAEYKDNDISQIQWLVGDPCDICAENANEIVDIGETFASGDQYPPAHPNCVCDVSPVVQFSQGEDVELFADSDLNKYDPDQPRDEQGRFGSGGASTETDTSYRDQHQAPERSDDFGSPATNIEEMMPNFYERPELYVHGSGEFLQASQESAEVVMNIRDNPDAPVTIYRAVPQGVTEINAGDWVSLSPTYAAIHNESRFNGEGHVITQQITANDLWFDGNDINEFGYDPVKAKALASKLNKYDEDQPRDEQGRFASGGSNATMRDISELRSGAESNANEVISTLNQAWIDARHELEMHPFDEENYETDYETILPEIQSQWDYVDSQVPGASSFTYNWAASFEAVESYREDVENGLMNNEPVMKETLAGLELVNASPGTDNDTWRGASFTAEEMQAFEVGKEIDLPFAAFTYSEVESRGFAIPRLGGRDQLVQFKLEEGAKAIPLGAMTSGAVYGEVVTSGRFEVTDSIQKGNIQIISIRQTGTFDTEGLKVK